MFGSAVFRLRLGHLQQETPRKDAIAARSLIKAHGLEFSETTGCTLMVRLRLGQPGRPTT